MSQGGNLGYNRWMGWDGIGWDGMERDGMGKIGSGREGQGQQGMIAKCRKEKDKVGTNGKGERIG